MSKERKSEGREKAAIGARLILTRQVLGLDQTEFAKRAGIAKSTYNQYESGTNQPRIQEAHKICDQFGLTLDWIYRGDHSGLRYELANAIKNVRQARAH